jgi:LDH2 family malate/lactate/ureidoglycolate dehydrogenase
MRAVSEARLTGLAVAALRGLGLGPQDAIDAARILVLADLFGIHTHGVSRIESYGERIDLGGIEARPEIAVERVAPAMARVDGGNGVGPLVGHRALRAAIGLARECGVGMVFARASNHFGPVSPYTWIAAQEGFASIIASNATTTMAPWGARAARLGNNPIGFGIPNPDGPPVFLDIAMSVAARAKIREAAKAGRPIPESWATDRDGNPTTDAAAALEGFLLPIGGHKGYGLALFVDLFAGLLSGAAYLTHVKSWVEEPGEPQDLGHFFLLFDAARLGPAEWLAERLADFARIVHSAPPADPAAPVLLPGESEAAKLAHHRSEGIPVDEALLGKLALLGARPRGA